MLLLGQHLCPDLREAELPPHRAGRGRVVAGEHHVADSRFAKLANRFRGGSLDRIRYRDETGKATIRDVVPGKYTLSVYRNAQVPAVFERAEPVEVVSGQVATATAIASSKLFDAALKESVVVFE